MRLHKVWTRIRGALLLVCALAIPSASFAANHFVRAGATGDGSGSDWTNAYTRLPATLLRGDTYYLAVGTYPPFTFNTPESAATLITIKKATVADHGTNVGWLDTYGAGQAIFTSAPNSVFSIQTGYLTIDGQSRTSLSSGHGIKLDGSGCTGSFCWDLNLGSGVSNITARYIEIQGTGDAGTDIHVDENIRALNAQNFTMQYLYIHDSSTDPVLTGSSNNLTLEYSLIAHNRSTPINHGEGWADQGSSNITIRYNVWRDIEGTAFIDVLCRGTCGAIANNWNIYGNVFTYTQGNLFNRTGVGDGIIACINGESCSNWNVYNNTVINIPIGNAGMMCNTCAAGSGNRIVENNLWFGNLVPVSMNLGTTQNYNTYLNTSDLRFTLSPNDTSAIGVASPFVDWVNGNFHLLAATAAGIALPAPFNADPDGTIRGADGVWDRGAYEFATGTATGPTPPQNLRAVVQ